MKRFQRILVHESLESSENPGEYAALLGRLSGAREVRYLHTVPPFELPADVQSKYPTPEALEESASRKLEERIRKYSEGGEPPMTCKVGVGGTVDTLLTEARGMESDLVVVGKTDGNSYLAEKMARKAPCSVLIVPESAPPDFSSLLVGLDYSPHSELAMEFAAAFAKARGIGAISVLNVASLPYGYGRSTLSEEEFKEMLVKDGEQRLAEAMRRTEVPGLERHARVVCSQVPALALVKHAKEVNADLLVVGCRGKDALSTLLLGSNSQEIIRTADIPVLAVKAKGTGANLVDALLGRA